MLVNYGVVLQWLQEEQNKQNDLGFFPQLAVCFLGDNLSSSFVERVNSALKLIMGNGRTSLHPTELAQLAILRINRAFMIYMKERRKKQIANKKLAAEASSAAVRARGGSSSN